MRPIRRSTTNPAVGQPSPPLFARNVLGAPAGWTDRECWIEIGYEYQIGYPADRRVIAEMAERMFEMMRPDIRGNLDD